MKETKELDVFEHYIGEKSLKPPEQAWTLVIALKAAKSRFQFFERAIVDASRQQAIVVQCGYRHGPKLIRRPPRSILQRRAAGR